ncbi:phosphatidylglycerol lysyltransferase domain-containing protein [Chryseobacterium camelliae]|uniref:phosphatidylglycerol lysyltransferase domain-containing protein n=1 Tax=Chryseobacterium camelliae TaxID=1265445 RepID=UPI000C1CB1DC|nr:phosphatidylglycerol lysyltransferase domain-containing protein [Chryseobacterium camelliae]
MNSFFSEEADGFVSFRTANGFAVVLEEPVCASEDKVTVIEEFESYCRKNSLKTCYYRIGEDGLSYFPSSGKQKLFIGQDALLDAENSAFRERAEIHQERGHGLEKAGYRTEIRYAPQSERHHRSDPGGFRRVADGIG